VDALAALKDMHDKLSYAGTAEQIGRAFHAVGKALGFTTCLLVDMTKLFDEVGPAIIFAAKGREPIEVFDAERRVGRTPLFVRARETEEPFIMSQLRSELKIGGEEWWSYFPEYFRDYDGMVVPIHERGKLAWYVGFAGREPDLSPRARATMCAAAYAAHARFVELIDAKRPNSPLTHRESQCLRLVAEGKTDSEVGHILEISPRTVRFHIGNAKAKLGVATRIQAVTKRIGDDG
jgi:DNA-binding CsgD family transcriptional regulator